MSLTGGGPFTVPAKDPNYKYQDIIILMSDGLNTENRWDGNGSSQSSAVDARMALACTNAKNAGLTIYTIHVNTDGDPTSQILKNCASDTSKFFTVTSSAQIGTVFTTRSAPTCRSCASRSNARDGVDRRGRPVGRPLALPRPRNSPTN